MIHVIYGESIDGPTIWLILDEVRDLNSFRQLISELSKGKRTSVRLSDRPDLFVLRPDVINGELKALSGSVNREMALLKKDSHIQFVWQLPRRDWETVLEHLQFHRPGHQYFEYFHDYVDIVVSFMENDVRIRSSSTSDALDTNSSDKG